MSVEKAKAFVEKLKTDSALVKKLQDAQKAYTGDKSDRDAAIKAILLPVAAEAGFEFKLEEFEEAFGGENLSEVELEAVAGGAWYDTLYDIVTSVHKEVHCNWQGMPW